MFLFFVVFSQYLYLSLSKINVHCAQLLWQPLPSYEQLEMVLEAAAAAGSGAS